MLPANYPERVYAGFLGMNIGIRLGAPVEPEVWTFERIEQVYGDIRDYVKPYRTFSADDDANGPIFFVRALYDDAADRELTPRDVARAWLNYAREGVGMFWWGGVGVSTEHTAYVNLRSGIEAPASGSIAVNGEILAEQIGGQIFVDVWGLLWPGDMEKAALYAERAASVSHDRNGLYGARFIAACIAKAFEADSIGEVVEAALGVIPADSLYAQVVRAVMDFHARHPADWRACRRYLEAEWGYDKYGGVCHIIPNAGVCALALLYGGGDFARSVYGGGRYAIDWRKQAVEFTSVTPMAQHRGEWSLRDGGLHYAVERNAAAFTGNYYTRDVEAEAAFTPLSGESHGFVARALGIERFYWLGLAEGGTVSIRRNDFGWTELASTAFPWEPGRTYALKMIVRGASLRLYIDGTLVLEAEDGRFTHGMYGVAMCSDASGVVGEFKVDFSV